MAEHGLGHIGRVRDWECVTQDGCAEKRALRLAQGDLPDIFFRAALTNEEVASLASAGQLVDLAPMLEQYAPQFLRADGAGSHDPALDLFHFARR